MEVKLNDASRQWIASKGGHLTIKTLEVKTCCAPNVQEVLAVPGKPKNTGYFHKVRMDNINIYIHKSINPEKTLTLSLSGFGFLKSIATRLQ
ncbi:CC/Se motif family (seleno)protein [Lentibacillus daqui]|uniref:CC/Se motif family (seleno)protein n=1 Tax=Lentibacillus daqui TaxID=2911514 RepID=UPI0022B1F85D|nr:CC/Se motif family (seleno)protein [Lentibacillus daqui]